jgi:hypothetical protein
MLAGHQSFSHLEITIATKMLAFSLVVNPYDEYYKIKESKTIECLKQFVKVFLFFLKTKNL